MVGYLNINSFDYKNNPLVENFVNLIFQSRFLTVINRATRVTRTTATAIDHIITDAILESTMHSGIIKQTYLIISLYLSFQITAATKIKNMKKPK